MYVTVDDVVFTPALETPSDRPFAFVYTLTIHNHGAPVTVRGRKWVVKEAASGRCYVTEGDGVVGCFPRLEPGKAFSYNSYHVVGGNSQAEGSFLLRDDQDRATLVRIPAFSMAVPC